MKLRDLFKSKCFFCERRDGIIVKAIMDDIYNPVYYFHEDCISRVLNNPERYGHQLVNWACYIQCNERKEDRTDFYRQILKEDLDDKEVSSLR